MFCKHCGHKLAQGERVCPACGTEIDPNAIGVQNFKVTIPDHEKELEALLEHPDAIAPVAGAVKNAPPAKEPAVPAPPEDLPDPNEVLRQPMISGSRLNVPHLDLPDEPAPQPPVLPESRSARRSRHVLTVVFCLLAVAVLGLTAVRLTTSFFDSSNTGLEPVSLNTLTDTEKAEVLSTLSAYSPLFDRGFVPKTLGVGAFFALLDLNNANNLYSAAKGQPERITEPADPLNRFVDETGVPSYYRIAEEDLKEVAERFGVTLPGSGNNSKYYYYDGAYYFHAESESRNTPSPMLHVSKAQHTEDGNFYIVLADPNEAPAVYAIVSRGDDAEAQADWSVLELSPEPLFREDGTRTAAQNEGMDYEMRHEEIRAVASDNTLVATYVLDYPYFTDTRSETAKTVNALYAQMLKSYQELSQDAEKTYRGFVKHSYDMRLLPGYTYMVSTVTYNQDGRISLLDELTEYLPAAAAKTLKAQQAAETTQATRSAESEEEPPATLAELRQPTITYSGTTVDTATGAFLRRDDIFSGDFEWYQSLLYRIFAGADNAELANLIADAKAGADTTDTAAEESDPYAPTAFEATTTTPDTTAADATTAAVSAAAGLPALSDAEAAIGQQIYASPWVLTESGVRFCYLGNGFYTYVTLPYSAIEE